MYRVLFSAVGVLVFVLQTQHAVGITATASSRGGEYGADRAVDDRRDMRWSSDFSDPPWLQIDGGKPKDPIGVKIGRETGFAATYEIGGSSDSHAWSKVFRTMAGDGGLDDLDFPEISASFLKLVGIRRSVASRYSVRHEGA